MWGLESRQGGARSGTLQKAKRRTQGPPLQTTLRCAGPAFNATASDRHVPLRSLYGHPPKSWPKEYRMLSAKKIQFKIAKSGGIVMVFSLDARVPQFLRKCGAVRPETTSCRRKATSQPSKSSGCRCQAW